MPTRHLPEAYIVFIGLINLGSPVPCLIGKNVNNVYPLLQTDCSKNWGEVGQKASLHYHLRMHALTSRAERCIPRVKLNGEIVCEINHRYALGLPRKKNRQCLAVETWSRICTQRIVWIVVICFGVQLCAAFCSTPLPTMDDPLMAKNSFT